MRRTYLIGMLWLGGLLPTLAIAGELRFADAFSSSMVLQRGEPIAIRGVATPSAEVTVTLAGVRQDVAAADDGGWRAEFAPLPAGGPYRVTATVDAERIELDDVLIGDVWLLSGQSNMQMGLDEVDGGGEATESGSSAPLVRVLSVPKAHSPDPRPDVGAQWRRPSPDALRKFTAVGWFFSEHLRQHPELADVPIGVIDSSFGGTAVEGWIPPGELPAPPADQVSQSLFGIPPSHLFNAMVAPLCDYKLKGAVWYQGESNAGEPQLYSRLLQQMMRSWRGRFGQAELPFLIVQLPAFEGQIGQQDFSWLREAQADACRDADNAWLAVTYDTTDGYDLHPREKREIGRRLALLARREVYGADIPAHGPEVLHTESDGGQMIVRFDQPVQTKGQQPVRGFALAGPDGDYRFAEGTVRGSEVRLTAPGVSSPITVRFAWGAMPDANLVGANGLPAAPFRTDMLPAESVAFKPLPTVYSVETPAYALHTGRNGSIASLVIRGAQFLSNDPNGGATVPGLFGPRNLARVELIGPRRLTLSDGIASVQVLCGAESLTWTLKNRGNDPLELRIALHPRVTATSQPGSVQLSRGAVVVQAVGVKLADDGATLIATAPPQGAARIEWKGLTE